MNLNEINNDDESIDKHNDEINNDSVNEVNVVPEYSENLSDDDALTAEDSGVPSDKDGEEIVSAEEGKPNSKFDDFVGWFRDLLSDDKRFVRYSILILTGLILLIYFNIIDNSTHFDDDFIFMNPDMHNPQEPLTIFKINAFRFVTFYTFAWNYYIHQDSVWGYYFVNILIHIANSILVLFLTRKVLQTPAFENSPVRNHINLISLTVALIFAAHPLQTQAVTYIYQRLASLAGLFYFGSLLMYLKFRLSDKKFFRKAWMLLATFILIFIGLFTKENTFTIPFAIVLFEIALLKKKFGFTILYIFLALLLVAFGVMLFFLFQIPVRVFFPIVNFDGETVSSLTYFATQFKVFPRYFLLLFLPLRQNIDHDIPMAMTFEESSVIYGIVFVSILLVGSTLLLKNHRLIFVGIFWIFGTIAVESSLIPIADFMYEHRLYIPMFGFALIIVSFINQALLKGVDFRKIVIFLLILISFYSVTSSLRNLTWNTEYTLWTDAATKSPNRPRAHFQRGVAALEENKIDVAFQSFQRTLELLPNFQSAFSYLGLIYFYSGNYPAAIEQYTKYIEVAHYKKKPDGYLNRARSYMKMYLIDSAKNDYITYLKLRPSDTLIVKELSEIYARTGKSDSIYALYKNIVRSDKQNFDAAFKLAMTYYNEGKYKESLKYFDVLVDNESLDPKKRSEIFNYRGTVFFKLNDLVSSSIDFENAVSFDPENMLAWQNKAILHRNLGEFELELEAINKIESKAPKDHRIKIAKARTLIKLEKYDEAKSTLNIASQLSPNNQEIRSLLKKISSKK